MVPDRFNVPDWFQKALSDAIYVTSLFMSACIGVGSVVWLGSDTSFVGSMILSLTLFGSIGLAISMMGAVVVVGVLVSEWIDP